VGECSKVRTMIKKLYLLKYLFLFSLLFCIVFLSGCSTFGTYNPATGKKEFVAVSTQEEVNLGKSFHKSITEKEGLSSNALKIQRVRRIGQKVADVSDRQDYEYNFYVIDKDEMNAFTSLGGNIYIYSGLVDQFTSDDQIAAVLAHEIGHCAAKHVAKKFQTAIGFSLLQNVVLSSLGSKERARTAVSLSTNTIMSLISSSYSRKDEYAADKLAVKYIYKSGYDTGAIIETLEILKNESNGGKGLLLLRSHPYLDDRIHAVKKEIDLVNQSAYQYEYNNY